MPLWIAPAQTKRYKLSLVPHWREVDHFNERYGDIYNVIDLRTRDVFKVIDEITSSEYILSSSLHGIIVPHAYGIPALWIEDGYIDTDGFKFNDYFSSVNVPIYKGFRNIEEILKDDLSWRELFAKNTYKSKTNIDLNAIQKGLLLAAPFKLKKKYCSIARSL